MSLDTDELTAESVQPPSSNGAATEPPPGPSEWKTDRAGREYISRPKGKSGIIIRRDGESIEQALARDAAGGDTRPRRKSKRPKMPDPPRQVDLKALEVTLAEALKSPAIMCATFGDTWAADHFTRSGPYLARNLILAADHNPWLRRKLEEAATGQDAMMKLVSLVGVGGALFAYAIPPVIYWFNLPVPEKSREMFGIPPRRERTPDYAAGPQSAEESAEPLAA